jgi:hypothetical protein
MVLKLKRIPKQVEIKEANEKCIPAYKSNAYIE